MGTSLRSNFGSDHDTRYPRESRDDVAAVARRREPEGTLRNAEEFGIGEASRTNWFKQAGIEDGTRAGSTAVDRAENRERRMRLRSLEQENEVLRRAAGNLTQANPKLGGSPI